MFFPGRSLRVVRDKGRTINDAVEAHSSNRPIFSTIKKDDTMDKPIDLQNAPETEDVKPAAELVEMTPESLNQVAGGQNGAGSGPPH